MVGIVGLRDGLFVSISVRPRDHELETSRAHFGRDVFGSSQVRADVVGARLLRDRARVDRCELLPQVVEEALGQLHALRAHVEHDELHVIRAVGRQDVLVECEEKVFVERPTTLPAELARARLEHAFLDVLEHALHHCV